MAFKMQNSRGGLGSGRGGRVNRGGARGGFKGGFKGGRGGRGGNAVRGRPSPGGKPRSKFNKGGPSKSMVVKHRHPGVFIIRSKEDSLATLNMTPGESVYNEKRVEVKETAKGENGVENKIEYRVWNPFRSKLGAAILGGVDNIWIQPGTKLLYLGAASGTTVSHCSDIVGDSGVVYAVEFSHRSGRDLISLAKKRRNIVPIVEDARHPLKYRMMMGMVDTIFSDVAQPDQARIVELNARYFLKSGGHLVMSIKASCVDSTATPEAVFAQEVAKLREGRFKPIEQITLEPYERNHAVVVASYRSTIKTKSE